MANESYEYKKELEQLVSLKQSLDTFKKIVKGKNFNPELVEEQLLSDF